jgi:allophanate hydrolase subunit 2
VLSLTIESLFGLGAWRQESKESQRRFGVPPGGPWDREAALLCRALAGVSPDAPVFELLHGTAALRAEVSLSLAVVGVKGEIEVEGTRRSLNRRVRLSAGSSIHIQALVGYVAVSPTQRPEVKLDWTPTVAGELRFLAHRGRDALLAVVDPTGSRAGIRLNTSTRFDAEEMPSEPSCVGAIQCTPSGQLIVIGPDGPTIGGYPRIGTVIDADLDLIPRLSIGQEVSLTPTELPLAARAGEDRQVKIRNLIEGLKIVSLAEMP